jgi:hypothetical protein
MAGDYNADGVVNAADYVVWRGSLGQTGVNLPADGNGNEKIDAGDFDVWRANFGQSAAIRSAPNLVFRSRIPTSSSSL